MVPCLPRGSQEGMLFPADAVNGKCLTGDMSQVRKRLNVRDMAPSVQEHEKMKKTTQLLQKGKTPPTKVPSGVKRSYRFQKIVTAEEVTGVFARCFAGAH